MKSVLDDFVTNASVCFFHQQFYHELMAFFILASPHEVRGGGQGELLRDFS